MVRSTHCGRGRVFLLLILSAVAGGAAASIMLKTRDVPERPVSIDITQAVVKVPASTEAIESIPDDEYCRLKIEQARASVEKHQDEDTPKYWKYYLEVVHHCKTK